jgi:hypothetical protein
MIKLCFARSVRSSWDQIPRLRLAAPDNIMRTQDIDSEQQARFIQRALDESARLRQERVKAQTKRINTGNSIGGVRCPAQLSVCRLTHVR